MYGFINKNITKYEEKKLYRHKISNIFQPALFIIPEFLYREYRLSCVVIKSFGKRIRLRASRSVPRDSNPGKQCTRHINDLSYANDSQRVHRIKLHNTHPRTCFK